MRSLDVRAVGRLDLGDAGPQGQSSSGSKSSRDQGVDGLARCNRATGASTDAASSKRSGAVRTADTAGGRIGGSPLIELTTLMVRARWRPG